MTTKQYQPRHFSETTEALYERRLRDIKYAVRTVDDLNPVGIPDDEKFCVGIKTHRFTMYDIPANIGHPQHLSVFVENITGGVFLCTLGVMDTLIQSFEHYYNFVTNYDEQKALDKTLQPLALQQAFAYFKEAPIKVTEG